ncbi:transcriptional regulator [Anaerosporomusa subterranea]|jgi:DNA-binding MarR family transcriptional regulator|uniref:Transcriptional regulator n=2 Tax=Anaerosporomusa subterranea TaxID=1794912 RepID=A0A154BMQ2_ANASB|nr:transcriptional regulator [Anaerosporomusa subterranea]MDF2500798.1 transcriptional regulator, MarR family [Anaerosporomusa subterranea]
METEALIVKYIDILSESMRQSMRKYKEEADSGELFNLTITQLHYLHAINEMDGPTFKQLVEKFNVQKSTVTDIVNRLIKRNMVYKKQSEEDLRTFHLYLAEKGKEVLRIESMGYYYFARKMTKCLEDDEKKQFTELLRKIVNEIDK